MKDEAARLTQWTTDQITFDLADGPGILRVYTRESFSLLAETLSRLAHQRIFSERDRVSEGKRAGKMKLGMTCLPRSEEEEIERLRALNPDATEHVVTAPMMRLAEAFGRFGLMLDQDPGKPAATPEELTSNWLTPKRLLAFEGIAEVQRDLETWFMKAISQALRMIENSKGPGPAAEKGMELMGSSRRADLHHLRIRLTPAPPAETPGTC